MVVTECKIVLTVLFEAWDFFTDTWVLATNVLKSEVSDLVTIWVVAYAVATIASILSMYLKLSVLREQLLHRRGENSPAVFERTRKRRKGLIENKRLPALMKHNKRLVKTSRAIRLAYSSLLVGVAECIPLGILQIIYTQRAKMPGVMGILSLVSTALMLGLKIAKVSTLPAQWKYRKKQRLKIARLEADVGINPVR